MNKKTKKMIRAICSVALSFVMLSGCASSNVGNKGNVLDENVRNEIKDYVDSTHVFEAKETNKPFIVDGKSEYSIVYPRSATSFESTAVSEFNEIFEMATNFTLSVRFDTGLQHDSSSKYVSIGNTALLASSGIDTELEELGRDGCKVVTKDNIIYIFGGEEGVMYGVYDFMSVTFDYEYYYDDCIEIKKNVENMNLKNYDIKDIPDVENRWKGWQKLSMTTTREEQMAATRFRIRYKRGSNMIPIHAEMGNKSSPTGGTHNSLECLPTAQHQGEHPNWYSTKSAGNKNYEGGQLCWTAGCKPEDFTNGKIPEEFEAMAQAISAKIQTSLMLYTPTSHPQYNCFNLGVEDNSHFCTCGGCTAFKDKYGAYSASAIVLMNRVAEITDAWMALEENEPYRRDMSYIFLAYLAFEAATAKYDESVEKYVPMDELTTPNENVGIYYAMINSCDYQLSFEHEMNQMGKSYFDAWMDIANVKNVWMYQTQYRCNFAFYDSFNFFNEGYKYIISKGIDGFVCQGNTGNNLDHVSAFSNLKIYLQSKLMWNANLDANELIDNWFKAMFKEGAQEVQTMFNETRAWMTYMLEEYDLYKLRSMFTDLYEPEYWPLPMLNRWMGLCDSALQKIEKYQTVDPEQYERLREHIELEWMAPAFFKLKCHSTNLSSQDRNGVINRFIADTESFGIRGINDSNDTAYSIDTFIASVS